MAYRHLVGPRNPLHEIVQILQRQVVPGIEPQPLPPRFFGSRDIRRNRPLRVGRILTGIGFGIEFHPVGTAGLCPGDHGRVGVDKERNPNTLLMETGRHSGQKFPVGHRIPPGIGSYRVGSVRYERHLRRNDLRHQRDELRRRIALDVELGPKHPSERPHVVVADMPGIGPRMDRNPVGAEPLDAGCGEHHVGQVAAPRIADNGNLIDIYAQLCHKIHYICLVNPAGGTTRQKRSQPGPDSPQCRSPTLCRSAAAW